MKILGINGLNHDAAVALIEDGEVLFAGHSERYSGVKNDSDLNNELMADCYRYGRPDKIAYFERPYLKKLRQLKAGQYSEVLSTKNIPYNYLKKWIGNTPIEYVQHHQSHAAAGYYTSPYEESAIVVIDAIGEFETCTIWYAWGSHFEKRYSLKYPKSLGLWYSAMTQRLGLKPQEDEYILMGMAGWGTVNEELKQNIRNDFFNDSDKLIDLKNNLHRGCLDWNPEYYKDDDSEQWKFDIAANVQSICEEEIVKVFELTKQLVPETDNCVYMGGVALNCVANSIIARDHYPNLWILPNPGDAGSSLGSAAYVFGEHVNWTSPFTGYDIKGKYPTTKVLNELLRGNIVGVANGRAEFGPRALGNRSLLADPRGKNIKDQMNEIKNRQKFRPFAPSVLEEHAHEIFDMPVRKSQFMQFTAPCKFPKKYPAICHVDNTSRVQTVSKDDNPGYYKLIKRFYEKTGCPMVLNTSLNIKGQPIVNSYHDGVEFTKKYNVKVF
jgi:carbamoyltransferase|tara:strand:+ start:1411 stop:2898 length:1488 start_codon:yes stop_codon:yes gene_type:complete